MMPIFFGDLLNGKRLSRVKVGENGDGGGKWGWWGKVGENWAKVGIVSWTLLAQSVSFSVNYPPPPHLPVTLWDAFFPNRKVPCASSSY
jgi:hypothetical protein